MPVYTLSVILSLITIMLLSHLFFSTEKSLSIIIFLLYIISLIITFIVTKREVEEKYDEKMISLKKKFGSKIRNLKREHDILTLEKTIRNGTRTLIKNAVEYFKIENIKNEMKNSAAIQNLQLDKYGQIVELLADFSLILPDYNENRQIVQKEINHQIEIYHMDEEPFAVFLQRIADKYNITVNKKIREKENENNPKETATCPRCAEKIPLNERVCKQCGYEFNVIPFVQRGNVTSGEELYKTGEDWVKKGYEQYREGKYEEAIRTFTIATFLNPDDGIAYYNRGIVYKRVKKESQALDDIKTAASLGHQKSQVILNSIRMMDTQEWQ